MGFSDWFQRKMNARTVEKIRRKGPWMMGMDMLILHTVGRRSGQQRETPLSWFPDGDGSKVVVASGGGKSHPDWYANLMANPGRAAVEVQTGEAVLVTPEVLEGDERERVWESIVEAQPRYAKYQRKSDRVYPLIRLSEG